MERSEKMAKVKILPAEIPPLGWGKEKECTFIGALEAALKSLDQEADYVDLMGMSAAAFIGGLVEPYACALPPWMR